MRYSLKPLIPSLILALYAGAAVQPSLDEVFDSLAAVRGFSEVAISPDGRRVAWVQHPAGIQVASVRSGALPQSLDQGEELAWAPDGSRLAFLSDREKSGQLQLYVVSPAGGTPRRLTSLTGYLAGPRWAPDGGRLALLFTENAPRAAGPLQPSTVETGVIGEKIYNQRLAIVDAAGGKVEQVSPPDLYVYEYDWSPDGRRFVFTAAPGPGDDNWYIARLYTMDASGGRPVEVWKPPFQIACPRWSPDGKSIACVGGLMSDEGMTGGDVFLVPAGGGEPRNLTPGMPASASGLDWTSPERILFAEHTDGEHGFAALDVRTGQIETLWKGPGVTSQNAWLPGLSLAHDGKTAAVIRHSFSAPPEIWAGPVGSWTQVTSLNSAVRSEWNAGTSLHWTSDAVRVQGWLLAPREVNPQQRYPLVVFVHGGPAGQESSHWPSTHDYGTMLAARGYFVLFPNPRGSFGQGEQFTRANVKDFGYGDLRDILAGVDAAVKTAPIDPARIGITGWSYGGFMTMWAVTQTGRFRAAAGAGLANWQSYYGQNRIDQWMIPYFGASVYDDPAVYARSSPINFIKSVKTPTLIVVGDRDAECPAPQSWEFWHALKTLAVPSEFIIYPDEGHMIQKPEHQRDIANRVLAWFDRYLK